MNLNGTMETVTASSLLEDLKSSDSKIKINAIKSLNIVAFALGKERTRNELLPFLADCIDEEEDETLIELARVLVTFLDFIGGKAHANKLFKIMELLLILDEPSVRNEALITFRKILSQINQSDFESDLKDLIKRLSSSDYINQRQAAINLIPAVFVHMSKETKAILVDQLIKFSKEEAPMIKRELANSLKDFSDIIDEELIVNLVNTFLKDSNDTVRIPIMDSIVGLRSHPDLVKLETFIVSVIKILSEDESWRVRLTVADKIPEVLSFPNCSQELKKIVAEVFAKLIDDKEAETRNTCCLKLEVIAEKIGKDDTMDLILIELKKLENDSVSYVRGALASTILRISPLIGKTKTNNYVFPLFLNIIKDENHDIRMTLIKTLDRLHEVINIDIFVQSIIPSMIEIASNKSWRIRIQITESIPVLARILNKNLFFDNILGFCITWLNDGVYAIREAACKLMKKLYDVFKGEDFEKRLMEKLTEMRASNSYLIRNTVLILAKEFLKDEFDPDFMEKKLLPLVIKSSKDKISNIRMNAAIVLKKMLKHAESKDAIKEVQLACDELKRDIDIDVINALIDT